jgi:hypothetical protein
MRALTLILVAGCNHLALQPEFVPASDLGAPDLTAIPDLTATPVDLAWQVPDTPCGPAPARFGGRLCGPSPSPCVLARDETIQDTAHFRNDAPDLTLGSDGQPIVFYWSADPPEQSWLARRGASGWSVESAPRVGLTGSLVADTSGELHVISYQYDSQYFHRGAAWSAGETLPLWADVASHNLVADSAGCLYATADTQLNGMIGRRQGGTWSWGWLDQNVKVFEAGSALALGSDGKPQTIYYGDKNIWWSRPPAPAEVVKPIGNYIPQAGLHIATAGTQPHLLFGDGRDLVYATRNAGWTVLPLESGVDERMGECNDCVEGAQCATHTIEYIAVDVAASEGGDVRLLYERVETSSVGQWGYLDALDLEMRSCVLNELSAQRTAQLKVAWPDGGGLQRAVVADGLDLRRGHAILDAQGTIHVAAYLYDPAGATVHYLTITP